ncbi:MAG TPA: hypothetical protein VFB62_27330, partial [Polyangiaceae bacterium]|nr:hypothetical protein [Polyangiaceae bacterium]
MGAPRHLAWLLVAAFGCGEETAEPTPPDPDTQTSCVPGELRMEDGSCRPAGLPPDLPPAGPSAAPLAGVPRDGCAMGFVHDGDGGCQPVLPDSPCAPGMIAVPGDRDCRAVAPCGGGTWGTIPIDTSTQFVDASFSGTSDGSAVAPWTSVQEAINAAVPGAIVALAAGSYVEDANVTKPLRIWGVCPSLVEIVSTTPAPAVTIDAADVELHTLAIRGAGDGIVDRGESTLDRVWVHELGGAGILTE